MFVIWKKKPYFPAKLSLQQGKYFVNKKFIQKEMCSTCAADFENKDRLIEKQNVFRDATHNHKWSRTLKDHDQRTDSFVLRRQSNEQELFFCVMVLLKFDGDI